MSFRRYIDRYEDGPRKLADYDHDGMLKVELELDKAVA